MDFAAVRESGSGDFVAKVVDGLREQETFEPVTLGHIRGHGCHDLFTLVALLLSTALAGAAPIDSADIHVWVSFGVTTNPTAEWISRQITEAFPWDSAPRYSTARTILRSMIS
jgi:hypothetical protein